MTFKLSEHFSSKKTDLIVELLNGALYFQTRSLGLYDPTIHYHASSPSITVAGFATFA